MKILESFIEDFFDRICKESGQLMRSSGNKTLKAQDVLAAIKIILPGELKTHAVVEAEKALESYRDANAE
jgi:histone H3/H4